MTSTPDFREDSYFEAYIHYVEERYRPEAEYPNPKEVDFIPPSGKGDNLKNEGTTPLDDEVEIADDEDRGDGREPDA